MEHIAHLSKDKKLAPLLLAHGPVQLRQEKNLCVYLCASIMSQQLSSQVANVIYQRFLTVYGGQLATPQQIVDTPFEVLREIGLSNAKVNYVKNVAAFELEHGMQHTKLSKMTNEEVIAYLLPIKGAGELLKCC